MHKGPQFIFAFLNFPFGPGLFYPIRAAPKVQILFGSFEGPLTFFHPKMKLLPHAGNPVQFSFFLLKDLGQKLSYLRTVYYLLVLSRKYFNS